MRKSDDIISMRLVFLINEWNYNFYPDHHCAERTCATGGAKTDS